MKILRSVNRRGFNVGTAGYFAILRPNTWFAASRLPERFHNLHERAEAAAQKAAKGPEDPRTPASEMTVHLDLKPQPEPLHPVRSALVILAAIAITLFLFWWIFMRPHPVWNP